MAKLISTQVSKTHTIELTDIEIMRIKNALGIADSYMGASCGSGKADYKTLLHWFNVLIEQEITGL
jgi:hypothetical protein